MDNKQLAALARVCQKYGISQYDDGLVKLTLVPGYIPPRPLTAKQIARDKELASMQEMSDEDLALYSAQAGFDLTKSPTEQDPS